MIKRIYAIVTEKDFIDFRRRAYVEGMKMGEVLSALCHAYARGTNIDLKNFRQEKESEHAESTGVDYVHKNRTGD